MFYVQIMKFNFIFLIIFINYVQTQTILLPLTTIVTFGDANTDTGNVYNLTNHQWPLVPPYYQGRFTNGPVWIDNLNISNVFNYAYGDATIDNDNLIAGYTGPNQTLVPGIRQQIVTYLTVQYVATMDLSRTLYVIWAGGEEYLINSSVSASAVVATLLLAVYDLLNIGIQKLIVVNLPPLQAYPGLSDDSRFSTLVIQHNNYLLSNITLIQAQYPQVSIEIFDLNSLITKILSNNSMYKLNKINNCWTLSNYKIISQCLNPNQYVFIDNYHFTTVIHEIIADNIQQLIVPSSSSSRILTSSKFYFIFCIIVYILQKKF